MSRSMTWILALLCMALGARAQLGWFTANPGGIATLVSPNSGGAPSIMLLYVPTAVKFSNIYFNVRTQDTITTDYYDLGIGRCPSLDCSQPNVQITIVCNLGSSGSFPTPDESSCSRPRRPALACSANVLGSGFAVARTASANSAAAVPGLESRLQQARAATLRAEEFAGGGKDNGILCASSSLRQTQTMF
jgi:hypothetical protein